MKTWIFNLIFQLALMLFISSHSLRAQEKAPDSTRPDNPVGILLMAHGGSKDWNAKVNAVATEVDKQIPTEVALGMADRSTLQAGIDKLASRGVHQIIAVPLFVSSHSGVVESTKYLLGVRADAPKDINDFVMSPEMHGIHEGVAAAKPEPIPQPVKSSLPLRMTAALDRDPLVAAILADRAAAIAKDPKKDAIVLVAHGPNDEATNTKWLADMQSLAQQIATHVPYARIDCVTLRDDADAPVHDAATAEFRKVVQARDDAGYHVLVVPLLLSYGGIENGIRQRLDGIEHIFSSQALLPDPRIVQWVLERAHPPSDPAKGF